MSPETTPEIILLCERAVTDVSSANTTVKNIYQSVRPLATFKEEGGFSEALTADRLAYRTAQSARADAPKCPKCGNPMIKRVAKRGLNAGNEFWSCSGYPNCNGTRSLKG
jgi:predicted RNA-binding Zn-ribbon protein involved in translation (DUF1610 family)